jgi:peptidylprolyl isomerase
VRRLSGLLALPMLALAVIAGCGGSSPKKSDLPSVAGSFGTKPSFSFPTKTAPPTLKSTVLRAGKGAVVAKGDLLVADYLGQVWGGKVFDNSYDRKVPTGFVIGSGKVIPGWDSVLVGKKIGDRVLMSIPPADGYGAQGNSQAGILGTDTLVFVVDIVASYGPSAAGDSKAVRQPVKTPGVTVKGALGAVPTVAVAKGTKGPAKPTVTVLAKGSGQPVATGVLILQYVAVGYDGQSAGSTWKDGAPSAFPVSDSPTTPFDALRGVPLGSRVLLQLPAATGRPAIAVVADLVAEPKDDGSSG